VRGHRGGESESDSDCMRMCICGWVYEERELEFPVRERGRARRGRRGGRRARDDVMMSFICSCRNKNERKAIYPKGTSHHTRLFRGPSPNGMKK
jgi:hypothetical protein